MAVVTAIGGAAQSQESGTAASASLRENTVSIDDSQTTVNAVMFDGQFIWVAVQRLGQGLLHKLNAAGQVLTTTAIGVAPVEMTYDGANVWVTNYDSSTLSVVDSQGNPIKTIALKATTDPEGILYDGKYIWVANNGVGEDNVSKFDAATMKLLGTYTVGNEPDSVAFDGTYIWVTNSYSNNVVKLDRETGKTIGAYPTGEYPLSIIFDGKAMWIGNGDVGNPASPPLSTASLTKIRAVGGALLGTFAAGNAVRGLASDGTSIWACNSADNTFTRVRISDGAPLGTYPTGIAPRDIAFDGVRMWITNSGDNTLTVVSPGSGSTADTQVLAPVLSTNLEAWPGVTSIQPPVAPGVAALAGILDALLSN
jgi:YVTN family beta-propeller protein